MSIARAGLCGVALVLWLQPRALAGGVSLLQDKQGISCVVPKDFGTYDAITINRRDTILTATKDGAKAHEFEKVRFLDTAVLLKSKTVPGIHALFQILPNGETLFTEGDLLPFFERDCDDTGASKTCKNETIQKLYWSPEKLSVSYSKGKVESEIDIYGFFANKATYFRARDKNRPAQPTLTLIDYGAPVEILIGRSSVVQCKLLPPEA